MDIIRLYLKDIKDIPLLTPEEEKELALRIRKKDKEAMRKMIRSNLRLVINIAKRYSHLGVPMMDLVEEGNLGLMKAVKKYNPDMGFRFSTYGAWWIKQYITRAIVNQGKTIRIPVYMAELITKWKRINERLTQKLRRKPGIKEVAKEMKLTVERVREISQMIARIASLDAPIGEGGEGQYMDLIVDETAASPWEELASSLRHERINRLLELITEREKDVLILRFGLEDGMSHTLEEVAGKFDITRERVRQIEMAAMKKLREYVAMEDEGYE